ncbi:hypothetical protein [Methylobacterium indicum]|uniref:Uncharacterized protein n=1 Tax=Methylobacterium indicum TaxID=1775910 RepID=A0A8H8X0Y5_9HYPH|nr:hypothetical protein [Methylobacterium indicum]BCM87808.1 hypothetical protein mvi_62690 [Methylobacterium indicum]
MKEKQLIELLILAFIVLVILYVFLCQQRREADRQRQARQDRRGRRFVRRQVGTNAKLSLTAQS